MYTTRARAGFEILAYAQIHHAKHAFLTRKCN